MIKIYKYILFVTISIFLSTFTVYPVMPEFFSTEDANFYKNAVTDGTMISENNTLNLAPKSVVIEGIAEPFVWKIYASSSSNVFVATGGNTGKIYKLDSKQKEFSSFIEVEERNLTSVVTSSDGTIYAASSPNSKIYVYSADGQKQNEVELDEIYVWDMIFDNSGNLYVATGGSGAKVLVLENGATLSDKSSFKHVEIINESHVMDLSLDEKNNKVYLGTSGSGLLVKLNDSYGYDVLYDTSEKEVHSIVINSEGDVFFGTANREENDIIAQLSGAGNTNRDNIFKNSLYKSNKNGAVQKLFNLTQTLIFGLVKDNLDNIYFVTGDDGKLYQISVNGVLNYVMDFDGKNITSISPTEDFIYLTTRTGQVYELTKEYASEGTLTSMVLDTTHLSRFGIADYYVNLPQGTSFKIETRSGNTSEVDSTWGQFESISEDGKIQSKSARFFQYRITLATKNLEFTPTITSLSFSFLPENLRPELYRPMLVTFSSQQKLKIEAYKKPALKEGQAMIIWSANDPNNDTMSFSLYYKLAGDTNYATLLKDSLTNYYIFDAKKLASGVYDFKIEASDYLDNGIMETMTNYVELLNVRHDKDAPVVSDVLFTTKDGKKMMEFNVSDEHSVLSSVRISSLNGRWRYLTPEDGLLDGKNEKFLVLIDSETITSITIETTDIAGNVGYYSYIVK